MADYSVLIADSSEEFRRAMREKLEPQCGVILCSTGREVLAAIRENPCRVIMTDLMLPDLDGISLLEAVISSGERPEVLAASALVTPYILSSLDRLGVRYLMEKPCSPELAADRILPMLRSSEEDAGKDIRRRISRTLLRLGFSAKLRGYAYLREAAAAMTEDPDQSIVKEIYTRVGDQFGVPAKLVEHSIRGAIIEAWKRRDAAVWADCFGRPMTFRPTGAAVIRGLAGEICPLKEHSPEKAASGQ